MDRGNNAGLVFCSLYKFTGCSDICSRQLVTLCQHRSYLRSKRLTPSRALELWRYLHQSVECLNYVVYAMLFSESPVCQHVGERQRLRKSALPHEEPRCYMIVRIRLTALRQRLFKYGTQL